MAGLVQKIKDMWNPPEDEYEDYYDEEQGDIMSHSDEEAEPPSRERESVKRTPSGNKVVNIHATAQLQVVLFKPEHFGEETRAVADELLKMHTAVLNLENTKSDISRRIIDFLAGVAYANGGKIKKVATNTYIITPYNVDLTGDDVLDELENSGVDYYGR